MLGTLIGAQIPIPDELKTRFENDPTGLAGFRPPTYDEFSQYSGLPGSILNEIAGFIPGNNEQKDKLMNGLLGVFDGTPNGGDGDGKISVAELERGFSSDKVIEEIGKMNATLGRMVKDPNFRNRTIVRAKNRESIFGPRSGYDQVALVEQGFADNEESSNQFNVQF